MAVRGVFASDMNIQGSRRGDFASGLLQVYPTGSAQLLGLSSGMESADASDTVVVWFEENHQSGRVQVTTGGGVNATATSLPLVDGSFYVPGVIAIVESTGEYVQIQAVAGNTMTIARGFGGTVAQAIANSAFLQRVGTAFEEGSGKPVAAANLGFPVFNYMQIFRNAWDVTGTARKIEYYTGDIVAKNKADCALFHSEDIERSLWFGRKAIGTQNNKPFRTMDGFTAFVKSNIATQTVDTGVDDLQTFLQSVFQKNIKGKPNERIAFCGNTVLGVLNILSLKQGTMYLEPGQTDFGMKVTKWITPFGDLSLMTHPLFNESPLWTKNLYVLHPGAVRMRYLRRTMPDDYDQPGTRAGNDEDFGILTTEMSMEYKAEATAGIYSGISVAAAPL